MGITPDDTTTLNREGEEIQALAKTDLLAYMQAMKKSGASSGKNVLSAKVGARCSSWYWPVTNRNIGKDDALRIIGKEA